MCRLWFQGESFRASSRSLDAWAVSESRSIRARARQARALSCGPASAPGSSCVAPISSGRASTTFSLPGQQQTELKDKPQTIWDLPQRRGGREKLHHRDDSENLRCNRHRREHARRWDGQPAMDRVWLQRSSSPSWPGRPRLRSPCRRRAGAIPLLLARRMEA